MWEGHMGVSWWGLNPGWEWDAELGQGQHCEVWPCLDNGYG